MARGLARLGDTVTCNCPPPHLGVISAVASNRTFINNRPAATVFSTVSCPGQTITGSPTVFIEDLPAHRLFDLNSNCGGVTIEASIDTFTI